MAKKIMQDFGHGGKDSGAVNGELVEKNMNLISGMETNRQLINCGFEVNTTRSDDTYVTLADRCTMANEWGADIFISQHYNAGGGDGQEAIHSIFHGVGEDLANLVADEIGKLGQNRHGVGVYSKAGQNGDYYAVIRGTKMPAIIVEPAFIDNAEDRALVDTEEEQRAIGGAVARAVCRLFDVPYTPDGAQAQEPAPVPVQAPPTVMFRVIMDGKQLEALSVYESAVAEVTQLCNENRYKSGIVQRNTDGAELFHYVQPKPEPVIDRNVLAVQKALNRLGFVGENGNALTEDGLMGRNTRHALRAFQSAMGIPETAEADAKTWDAINEIFAKPYDSYESPHYDYATRYIQYRVGTGGDKAGYFSKGTKSKVKDYQRSRGLGVDGEVGSQTWKSLIG